MRGVRLTRFVQWSPADIGGLHRARNDVYPLKRFGIKPSHMVSIAMRFAVGACVTGVYLVV